MNEPGRYDELCTGVRRITEADGAIVIIFGGLAGTGFSAQLPKSLAEGIPGILRTMANEIEGAVKTSEASPE